MANATSITPLHSRLDPGRVASLESSVICYLMLRTAAVRGRYLEGLEDIAPRDRALLLLFAEATQLCQRELRRRAQMEQDTRGLGLEALDPGQVVEIDAERRPGPTELAA